jgi:hypothetical protein
MNFARTAGAGILVIASCVSVARASISGTFDIAGTIIVTNTMISWQGIVGPPPFVPDKATVGNVSGSFGGLSGTQVTIRDLNNATEPVGTFPPQPFVTFDAAPALGTLLINDIFAGIYPTAGCAASPPAVGQTCTPGVPGGSPFNFVNNPPPNAPQATATFAFSGLTSDGGTWVANFTSQFGVPFQTVLAQLAATGRVTNTYSATFTVTAAPVPEPGTFLPLFLGLGLVALYSSKKRVRV